MTTTIPNILYRIGDIADRSNMGCYLVGGFVRDMILERPCTDIDIMVIGDPVPFAKQLREELHGKNFVLFERFRTAQLELPGPKASITNLNLSAPARNPTIRNQESPLPLPERLKTTFRAATSPSTPWPFLSTARAVDRLSTSTTGLVILKPKFYEHRSTRNRPFQMTRSA